MDDKKMTFPIGTDRQPGALGEETHGIK